MPMNKQETQKLQAENKTWQVNAQFSSQTLQGTGLLH